MKASLPLCAIVQMDLEYIVIDVLAPFMCMLNLKLLLFLNNQGL
jgi:hypothetical protein